MSELLKASKAFVSAELKIHGTLGSTATCYGGVGGQAITSHCSWLCHNPKHDADIEAYENARRDLIIAIEKEEN